MKKQEIKVGGHYRAKVSGKLVTVRVDGLQDTVESRAGKLVDGVRYHVTNLSTGRKTTFRSAAKFREAVVTKEPSARTAEAIKDITAGQSTRPVPS